MKRRDFLKTGAGLGSMLWLYPPWAGAANYLSEDDADAHTLRPGDSIPAEALIEDSSLQTIKLLDLCLLKSHASVILLYIYGGAAVHREDRLGGIWCPDTYDDLHVLRYIHTKYRDEPVDFIPVACPPLYSWESYGLEKPIFLAEPDDSRDFKEEAAAFIEQTEAIVEEGIVPAPTYYDLRFRLLFNRAPEWKPGPGYGQVYPWQGRFRAAGETQKYGTPTLWLLNAEGTVLEPPFHGNIYSSAPYTIGYTVRDVDAAVQRNL